MLRHHTQLPPAAELAKSCAPSIMAYVGVVTGAAGFVGSELVKQLLERGWTVRATVRDTSDSKRVEHLLRLANALPGTLQLFEADLLRDGSFNAACAGTDYVFHTASPFFIQAADPQRDLVDPAVAGTRNVLAACAAAGATLKRVVLTSSVAGARRPRRTRGRGPRRRRPSPRAPPCDDGFSTAAT
jgi:nucleoside-diphosphate-sugar epimerase